MGEPRIVAWSDATRLHPLRGKQADAMRLQPYIVSAMVVCTVAALLLGCGESDVTSPETTPEVANQPPWITPLPTSVFHDEEYHQQVYVSDPDGDSTSTWAVVLPVWLTFSAAEIQEYAKWCN